MVAEFPPHLVVYLGWRCWLPLLCIPTFLGQRTAGRYRPSILCCMHWQRVDTRPDSLRLLGGMIGQFGSACHRLLFYNVEDFFPALIAAYIAAQGLGDIGIDVAWRTWRGRGARPVRVLDVNDPKKLAHIGYLIQIASHLATVIVIIYMGRWLYSYRPRKRIIVIP